MEYSFRKNRITGGIGADEKYWEALEEGAFRLPRCVACQRWMWPAHHRCAECGSWDQEWVDVEPKGTVYSWTRSHGAFDRTPERAEDVPYVVVLVQIESVPEARVLGVLKGSDQGLKVGAPVVGSIDPPSPKTKGYAAIRWSLVHSQAN